MKPTVTIDLAEYIELTGKVKLEGSDLTAEEYQSCTTHLVAKALHEQELFTRIPADGIILQTLFGRFRATIATVRTEKGASQEFHFTKLVT